MSPAMEGSICFYLALAVIEASFIFFFRRRLSTGKLEDKILLVMVCLGVLAMIYPAYLNLNYVSHGQLDRPTMIVALVFFVLISLALGYVLDSFLWRFVWRHDRSSSPSRRSQHRRPRRQGR